MRRQGSIQEVTSSEVQVVPTAIAAQESRIAGVDALIAELVARLNQISWNSSRPRSSDPSHLRPASPARPTTGASAG
ncbi:DUF6444 domain-containing protein [Paludisphaera mucosa]|uniref:DUF6444 domain-containing protein n=1 Tax=Paludisphaera mucosa TaxID=3030827 RepID=A0ABT6FD37_9BACT|nr:DUF6444 domain-containing protein [Paludisphaera mucosa]MDG3005474.1 DUF6444 domain-containing protein [Paludisphaera mucosa]